MGGQSEHGASGFRIEYFPTQLTFCPHSACGCSLLGGCRCCHRVQALLGATVGPALVGGKDALACATVAAQVAPEGLLAAVGPVVDGQVALLCTAEAAQVAPEGLLTAVRPPVGDQGALVRTAVAAQVTLEGLLAAVGPVVESQHALPRTAVAA
jgi:hypothetical protein